MSWRLKPASIDRGLPGFDSIKDSNCLGRPDHGGLFRNPGFFHFIAPSVRKCRRCDLVFLVPPHPAITSDGVCAQTLRAIPDRVVAPKTGAAPVPDALPPMVEPRFRVPQIAIARRRPTFHADVARRCPARLSAPCLSGGGNRTRPLETARARAAQVSDGDPQPPAEARRTIPCRPHATRRQG
jgi:hypothetical protein